MRVLIIGGGGREHALAWQCAKPSYVKAVFVAPGNAGTQLEHKLKNIAIAADDIDRLVGFAKDYQIDLTIVGSEAGLVMGIVDAFHKEGLAIFAPTKAAAQLEGSKIFCKDFLIRNNIATAFYQVFTEIKVALAYIEEKGAPLVIKADGLAGGKGVIIAHSKQAAIDAATDMLINKRFGKAGSRIIIEEFLSGEELSFIVMTDGKNILPMATSQDHKARDDNDKGPNTGGMGAYSPALMLDKKQYQHIMSNIIKPTITAMAAEGRPYVGFLYAGLLIDKSQQVKVLEYNCRFGDPEAQPIMMRLRSDLVHLCQLGVEGRLDRASINWDRRSALAVVLAAKGYPSTYQKGQIIKLPPNTQTSKVFHAGTKNNNDNIISNGGRVLCATALGDDIKDAQNKAYALVKKIKWQESYYRNDIGFKAIKALKVKGV